MVYFQHLDAKELYFERCACVYMYVCVHIYTHTYVYTHFFLLFILRRFQTQKGCMNSTNNSLISSPPPLTFLLELGLLGPNGPGCILVSCLCSLLQSWTVTWSLIFMALTLQLIMDQSFCRVSFHVCLFNASSCLDPCFVLFGQTITVALLLPCQPGAQCWFVSFLITMVAWLRWRLPGLSSVQLLSPFLTGKCYGRRCLRFCETHSLSHFYLLNLHACFWPVWIIATMFSHRWLSTSTFPSMFSSCHSKEKNCFLFSQVICLFLYVTVGSLICISCRGL